MAKVLDMVKACVQKECISLVVIRGKTKPPARMNCEYEDQMPISEIGEPVVYDVDAEGVIFLSQGTAEDDDMVYIGTQQSKFNASEIRLVAVEDGDCFITQESMNMQNGKGIMVEQNLSDSFPEENEHFSDSLAEDSEDNVQSERGDNSYDIDEATKGEFGPESEAC
jgi:hypothetical protein